MADTGDDDTSPEDDLGAAVDDALASEIQRQKARFVQRILGADRIEGTGRSEERWDEGFDHRHGQDPPEE